jgi:hypothetical protein
MSRLSSLVFGTVVAGVVASIAGCQVEASVKSETRFTETNVVREDTAEWTGGPIDIKIEGVGLSRDGGVTVRSDPNVTKVKATARMLAMAPLEDKPDADLSLEEAKETFTLSNSGGALTVRCAHGKTHGSSSAGKSGCEFVDIVVPAGTADKPLDIKVLSGSGTLKIQLANAVIKKVASNSSGGVTEADLPDTKGGVISLVSESSDIELKLPSDFAADEVILEADADKIDLGPFADIKNGVGAGGRGQAGSGLSQLSLRAKAYAGSSTGTITLR